MVHWTASKLEVVMIQRLAKRASELAEKYGDNYPVLDASMDLEAVHCNDCPLDLEKLAKADDFNFMHDVFGIRRHLDRTTGILGGRFLPRCAMPTGLTA